MADRKTSYDNAKEPSQRRQTLTLDKLTLCRGRCVKILADSAAHVAPARRRASGPSRRLLAPSLRSVRWSATPPGTAHAAGMPRRGGAPIRSAPARHGRRPLRSRRPSRARPGQTGGDPAAPGWRRARLNPAQPVRDKPGRAAPGSARPLAGRKRPVSASGSAPSSPRGGRMAPRCAKPWARRA
jgi:hypothetical protein